MIAVRTRSPVPTGFREAMPLTADSLTASSTAIRESGTAHRRELHGFGILTGLDVKESGSKFTLNPGVAYDLLGRELIVAVPREIDTPTIPTGSVLDLWLKFAERTETTLEGGTRIVEATRVHFTIRPESVKPTRAELELLSKDYEAVYLGSIPEKESLHRIYLTLIADRGEAASGTVRMLLGPENSSDPREFALELKTKNAFTERMSIDGDGRVRFTGNVTVSGPSPAPLVAVGKIPTENPSFFGLGFAGTAPPPEVSRPWRMYRADVPDAKAKADVPNLRIEIANPGKDGSPFLNRFAVGATKTDSDKATFDPYLLATADGNVFISGKSGQIALAVTNAFVIQAGDKSEVPPPPSGAVGSASLALDVSNAQVGSGPTTTVTVTAAMTVAGQPLANVVLVCVVTEKLSSLVPTVSLASLPVGTSLPQTIQAGFPGKLAPGTPITVVVSASGQTQSGEPVVSSTVTRNLTAPP